jgi:hypothetical protein
MDVATMTINDFEQYAVIEYEVGTEGEVHWWVSPQTMTLAEVFAMVDAAGVPPDSLRIHPASGIDMTPEPAFGTTTICAECGDGEDDDERTTGRSGPT